MSDIASEVEAWLEQDVPADIERMVEIAQLQEWHPGHGNPLRGNIQLPHARGDVSRYRPIPEITPDDLRAIAAAHDRFAEYLEALAVELRDYAEHLEQPTEIGGVMREHLATMGSEARHRKEVYEESWRIAHEPGGVHRWTRLDEGLRAQLFWAGLLRIEDVRDAYHKGTLARTEGIGPKRLQKITVALYEAVAA